MGTKDKTQQEPLGDPVSVQFTRSGKRLVRKAAALSDQSMSAFIRAAAEQAAKAVKAA